MTDSPIVPPLLPAAPADSLPPFADVTDWQSLPPSAARMLAISGGLWGALCAVGAASIAWTVQVKSGLLPPGTAWIGVPLVTLAFVAGGVVLGLRRWRFSQWKLDATGMHVRRGQFWRREILVPRSRVQHLDIERGPIERHFGLATLIVHTAGTRLHAVRQPGFADADAVSLRDALLPASDRHDDVV